jgi:invasion protein IalB
MLRHAVFAAAALMGLAAQTIGTLAADDQPQPSVSTGAAQNGPQATQTRTIGSWTVRCYRTAGSVCDASQFAFERKQNLRVLGVSIAFVPERNLYSGRFVVPLLVSFAKGMTIRIGSFELPNLKFRRCERDGCYVEGVLPSQMINAMEQAGASKGSIQIAAVNGKLLTIPIVLDGFADSVSQMRQWDAQKSAPAAAKP